MWFHRHRWRVISASCDGKNHWMDPVGWTVVTSAVAKCECGQLKTFQFIGAHSIEALQGEATEVDRVLKSLEH
jgi:hypothetical protein